jgi:hypothetical protein
MDPVDPWLVIANSGFCGKYSNIPPIDVADAYHLILISLGLL